MVALTITVNGEKSEARIIKKMHERVIKSFMDTIIMAELQNGPISGYDVIAVNKKRIFNFGGRPAPH
jgi:hypothetical protein